MRLAVIGAGAAGLTAVHLLQQRHQVTLFEGEWRLGGHALTFRPPAAPGLSLDIGFMVLNDRNYPNLLALFDDLGGIALGDTDMSFSFVSPVADVEYALADPGSLFAPAGPGQRPDTRTLRLLREAVLFGQRCHQALSRLDTLAPTLGAFLAEQGCSKELMWHYVLPSTAAIWSMRPADVLEFPTATYLRFMDNHGMLLRRDLPQWRYVRGGSKRYVDAIRRGFRGTLRVGTWVTGVCRQGGAWQVVGDGFAEAFDGVVFACHGQIAARMLVGVDGPLPRLLDGLRSQSNPMLVHTDAALMPSRRAHWAAWNFREEGGEGDPERGYSVTYHLNRLQGLGAEGEADDYFVTLNTRRVLEPGSMLLRTEMAHPIYDSDSPLRQQQLWRINGRENLWFCGAYMRYGFHEDAVWSAARVAADLDCTLAGASL